MIEAQRQLRSELLFPRLIRLEVRRTKNFASTVATIIDPHPQKTVTAGSARRHCGRGVHRRVDQSSPAPPPTTIDDAWRGADRAAYGLPGWSARKCGLTGGADPLGA